MSTDTKFNLPEQAEQFLHWMKCQHYSDGTVSEYEIDLTLFFRFIQKDLLAVTRDDVAAFTTYLKQARQDGPAAVRRRIASVKSFYDYLYDRGLINRNPAYRIKTEAYRRPVREPMTDEECDALLAAARSGRHSMRNVCIVTLMLNLGLRVSEVAKIDVGDIHDDTILIHGKGGKDRELPLNAACKDAIEEYASERGAKDGPLFVSQKGNRISVDAIQAILKDCGEKAGIDRRVHPHLLRHQFATKSAQDGMDILTLKDMMGHECIHTGYGY